MSNIPTARLHAQSYFKSSEQHGDVVRAEIEKERAAVDAKTSRLKALRLAKEAEEQVEAQRLATQKSEQKALLAAQKLAKKAPRSPG